MQNMVETKKDERNMNFHIANVKNKAYMNRYKLYKTATIFFSSEPFSETGY